MGGDLLPDPQPGDLVDVAEAVAVEALVVHLRESRRGPTHWRLVRLHAPVRESPDGKQPQFRARAHQPRPAGARLAAAQVRAGEARNDATVRVRPSERFVRARNPISSPALLTSR